MIRAIIIDDERLARNELKKLLMDFPEIEIISEAANASEGVEQIENLNPELVFLDIQMPGKTGFDMLAELDKTLHAKVIELCFAELKDPVKDKLKRFGLFTQFGEMYFFPTIGAAVSRYLETHDVEWEDWENEE